MAGIRDPLVQPRPGFASAPRGRVTPSPTSGTAALQRQSQTQNVQGLSGEALRFQRQLEQSAQQALGGGQFPTSPAGQDRARNSAEFTLIRNQAADIPASRAQSGAALSLERELGLGAQGLQRELGQGQLALGGRSLDLQGELGRGGLDLQRELGVGGLDLERQRFGEEQTQNTFRRGTADKLLALQRQALGQFGEGGDESNLDESRRTVSRLLGESQQDFDAETDPRAASFRLAQQRAEERTRRQLAESRATGGLSAGALDAESAKAREARAVNEAAFEAGLGDQDLQQRRALALSALGEGSGLETAASARKAARDIARLQAGTQSPLGSLLLSL